jgi:hypothetical protein
MPPTAGPGPTRRRLVPYPPSRFVPRGEATAIAWRAPDPSHRVRFLTAGPASVTTGFHLQLPPDQAFQRVERASNTVGKVIASLHTTGRVLVRARFGFQSVKVRVTMTGCDGVWHSMSSVTASGATQHARSSPAS